MASAWRLRLAVSGSALLPFVGVWLSHSLEYARVWGTAGLEQQMRGSVHSYMLPLAALLAALGALCAFRCRRLWMGLALRLEDARGGIVAAWRSRPAPCPAADGLPSRSAGVVALLVPVLFAQLALYLLQENVEAWSRSAPAPGLGAVTGIHWAAPLIHLGVALMLCLAVGVLRRWVRHLALAVDACERLLRAIVPLVGRPPVQSAPRPSWDPAPLDRHGRQLWRRPPPVLASA